MHEVPSCYFGVLIYTLKCEFCRDILLENVFKRCVDLSPHGNVSSIAPMSGGGGMDSVSFFMNFVQWLTKVHVIVKRLTLRLATAESITSIVQLRLPKWAEKTKTRLI